MSDAKFCKDCRHFHVRGGAAYAMPPDPRGPICKAPESDPPRNILWGHVMHYGAAEMRGNERLCGRLAKWFEPLSPGPTKFGFMRWLKGA